MRTQAGMENKAAAPPVENKTDASKVRVKMRKGVLAGRVILVERMLAATLVRDGKADYGEAEFRDETEFRHEEVANGSV